VRDTLAIIIKMKNNMDVRTGAAPWILKIQHSSTELAALRFQDFNAANEFMMMVGSYFKRDAQLSLMSQSQFIQIAHDRNHPEWIDLIEDAEILGDDSDF
jgi:hypothetical protein